MSLRLFGCFALIALVAMAASPTFADQAQLETYEAEDGQSYFALTMPPVTAGQEKPHDVVVLLDTSASQAGYFRHTAMGAVQRCIESLKATDRVQVLAVDLDARPMNDKLVSPGDASVAKAMEKIRLEPPLGSTDMQLALTSAAKLLDNKNGHERTIVYIGDGISSANLLQTESFRRLVSDLRDQSISVHSFALGPKRDVALLAALANQTGGNLFVDTEMTRPDEEEGITYERAIEENRRRGGKAGQVIAQWVHGTVVRPDQAKMPEALSEAYPSELLPMRSDRETIVVGKLKPNANVEQLSIAAGESTWQVKQVTAHADLSYLPQLVEQAERDGGLTLTTLGVRGLDETGRGLLAGVDELTNLAERAIAMGDREGAGRIVEAVLRRDPGNLRAKTVQTLVERDGPITPADLPNVQNQTETDSNDLNLVRIAQADEEVPAPQPGGPIVVGPESGQFIDGMPARDSVVDGSYLTDVERQNRVLSEMVEKEVEVAISEARDVMRGDPEAATQNLKLTLQNVRTAPRLLAEVRAQLEDRLKNVLREAARAAVVDSELRQQAQEREAIARERKQINDRLLRKEERLDQLVSRMNALMDERRYDEALELTNIMVEDEDDPTGVTPVVAALNTQFVRNSYLMAVTREARWRNSWEAFYQVELSAVPFPDEPPIVYPPADEWEELTARREKYKAVDLAGQDGAEQVINRALSDPLNSLGLEFQDAPLSEVVDFLRTEYNIEVQLDLQALDDLGLSPDDPITVNLRNISLRSALRIMLRQLDLTYVISDEVLLITSEDEALTRLQVKVYPVADLVLPIQTPSQGGFGGMGGMGMGGMGGMGMGGGMGGMGGMGGFGGGGAFSVPEDDDATQEQPSTKATEPKSVANEAVSPELYWDGYFGSKLRDESEVRGKVRELMKSGSYDQVAALIQAALRHGQPQIWMYEALGLAMQMDGQDKAQIERAVMSATDFSRTADELAYIAQYLVRLDLNKRALQVYQQVVKVDPLRNDAYAMGLRAAQRAEDLEGIKWATIGILEQAWPADQEVVKDTAWRVAKATIEDLTKAGKTKEARSYKAQIAKAIERDCVIRVSWTGDADVDMAVIEPGGTICSVVDPRSAGGGVNMGDTFTNVTDSQSGIYSETYVCPKAFAGEYQAKITPVWGKVAAGKVTVEVVQHLNNKTKVQHQRQQLAMGEDGVTVKFNLEEGRRDEPLEVQQVAQAIKRQQAVSRAVLAQQMQSMSDPSALPFRADNPADAARRRRLLAGNGGAVGFQPVIITLPEGTNLMATGVVSADRRYVRITALPFFSTIGDVQTFTFAGSATDVPDDGGDGGGDGGGGNGGG